MDASQLQTNPMFHRFFFVSFLFLFSLINVFFFRFSFDVDFGTWLSVPAYEIHRGVPPELASVKERGVLFFFSYPYGMEAPDTNLQVHPYSYVEDTYGLESPLMIAKFLQVAFFFFFSFLRGFELLD
jgi:hypothetical protein